VRERERESPASPAQPSKPASQPARLAGLAGLVGAGLLAGLLAVAGWLASRLAGLTGAGLLAGLLAGAAIPVFRPGQVWPFPVAWLSEIQLQQISSQIFRFSRKVGDAFASRVRPQEHKGCPDWLPDDICAARTQRDSQ